MRIAIFSDNFYPELSGVTDSIINLAIQLSKNHKVDFYVPEYPKKSYKIANKEKEIVFDTNNITVNRLQSLPYPTSNKQGRLVIPSVLRWMDFLKNKPDIIHTHLFGGCGIESIFTSKFLKIPLVGTNHTDMRGFVKYSPIDYKNTMKYINWFYHQCDIVSVPSKSIYQEMRKYGFKKNVIIISNPIDTQKFSPVKNKNIKLELKKKFTVSNFNILYAGRIVKEKNIDTIIKAIYSIKDILGDFTFTIAGNGNEKNNLEKLVKKYNLEKNVIFTGTLDRDTLSLLYKASDIFTIASSYETQSIVTIEALSSGLPVIGVNFGAIGEYVKHNKNGLLFDVQNVDNLSKNILKLYKDEKLIETLGKNGYISSKEFSAKHISKKWEDIYKNTIDSFKK